MKYLGYKHPENRGVLSYIFKNRFKGIEGIIFSWIKNLSPLINKSKFGYYIFKNYGFREEVGLLCIVNYSNILFLIFLIFSIIFISKKFKNNFCSKLKNLLYIIVGVRGVDLLFQIIITTIILNHLYSEVFYWIKNIIFVIFLIILFIFFIYKIIEKNSKLKY